MYRHLPIVKRLIYTRAHCDMPINTYYGGKKKKRKRRFILSNEGVGFFFSQRKNEGKL